MSWLIGLMAALGGYLAGSVSCARLVLRWTTGSSTAEPIRLSTSGGSGIESDAMSATTVRLNAGTTAGCLTGLLDMGKVALPALAFKLAWPEQDYYLIVATMGTVGHVWPVFHGFKGGRGMSPIAGGMLVLDWRGVLVTNIVALLLGSLVGDLMVMMAGGFLLMLPWTLLRTRDVASTAYVITANVIYLWAMLPELRQYRRLREEGELRDALDMAKLMGMERLVDWVRRSPLRRLLSLLARPGGDQY